MNPLEAAKKFIGTLFRHCHNNSKGEIFLQTSSGLTILGLRQRNFILVKRLNVWQNNQFDPKLSIPDPITYFAQIVEEGNASLDNISYLTQHRWPQPCLTILDTACEMFQVRQFKPVCLFFIQLLVKKTFINFVKQWIFTLPKMMFHDVQNITNALSNVNCFAN